MAKVTIPVTPPRVPDSRPQLPPREFLKDPKTLENVNSRCTLKVTAEKIQQFELKPKATEDESIISSYHDRVRLLKEENIIIINILNKF